VVGDTRGIITETEAYRGADDEASHAFSGITKRSSIMFRSAGHVYVYLIYGMYHCLNIVTENEGQGAAVLVRGLKLPDIYLDGPGKICKHLNITREHSGLNLLTNADMYVEDGIESPCFISTPRIGIKKAADKPWRFVLNQDTLLRLCST
jgi:DNA-3-methyladenine glycosylase